MGYKEFKKQGELSKEKPFSVISDLIGETIEDGDLYDFIRSTKAHLKASFNAPTLLNDQMIKNKIVELLKVYNEQVDIKQSWFTTMGLIERKIIQYRYYRNTQVSISTQAQKSGDNKYNYILLRSPFIDSFTGKKEIRIYFNKLEDYPKYKTIDNLIKNEAFYNSAIEAIRKEMENIMTKDGIDFKRLFKEFENLESVELILQAKELTFKQEIENLQNIISALSQENLRLKQELAK